ncbi:MAG: hypothetical protein ACTS73_06080 [Arsenophonus sp. NEOnobi-MAG3]
MSDEILKSLIQSILAIFLRRSSIKSPSFFGCGELNGTKLFPTKMQLVPIA